MYVYSYRYIYKYLYITLFIFFFSLSFFLSFALSSQLAVIRGRFTYKFNKHISYLMHALSRECFDRGDRTWTTTISFFPQLLLFILIHRWFSLTARFLLFSFVYLFFFFFFFAIYNTYIHTHIESVYFCPLYTHVCVCVNMYKYIQRGIPSRATALHLRH